MREQIERETRAARRDRWRALISAAEGSGESIRAFCLKQDLRESQYYYWKKQLRLEQARSDRPESRKFVFVGTAGAMEERAALELIVERGWRLRIGAGVEASALRVVLGALAAQS
jgi:transposase-like protein